MDIPRDSATNLCNMILDEIVRWPAVNAVLQSGGLEEKARGQIEKGIIRWLAADHPQSNLTVIPEYMRNEAKGPGKTTDFSLIRLQADGHPPQSFLSVQALFEVKANYATQTGQNRADGGEFRVRLTADKPDAARKRDAIEQTRRYRSIVGATHAYLLYLVAAPRINYALPPKPRDSGWEYYEYLNRPDNRDQINVMSAAKDEIANRLEMRGLTVRGDHLIAAFGEGNPRNCSFYCCLIAV